MPLPILTFFFLMISVIMRQNDSHILSDFHNMVRHSISWLLRIFYSWYIIKLVCYQTLAMHHLDMYWFKWSSIRVHYIHLAGNYELCEVTYFANHILHLMFIGSRQHFIFLSSFVLLCSLLHAFQMQSFACPTLSG